MLYLNECTPEYMSQLTKVFVNGRWIGVITNPDEITLMMRQYKRNALFPIFTSIHWNIQTNELIIYTDAGRLCRPVYYFDELSKKISFEKDFILNKLKKNEFNWGNLISGFNNKKDPNFNLNNNTIYDVPNDLYDYNNLKELNDFQSVIEYIDTAESETSLISLNPIIDENDKKKYTHYEIHPSLLLGVLGNQIVFPENNQLPRDVFACGQSKQAISLYHSNYQSRMDKMGVVLNYGQIPLVKSRYMKYINNEEHPYGENVVVAIACYTGYNVEDSILFNEGSINRGLFRTTYYSVYESREESAKIGKSNVNSVFSNIEKENVVGLKPGCDYSDLDKYGIIKENTELNDKKVLIGKIVSNIENPNIFFDKSEVPKKGQLGYVDKSFITEGEEGVRIAKVKVREERMPSIGDKFCSRCGQKGTVGLIIPEEDMPFTSDGIKPDIIINPHALPSRMTIGQLIETLMGKACSIYGGFGDCTAFVNKGSTHKRFGQLLNNVGLNSSGYQILYNGKTGEQLETEIFIGPTYYMRLKHMVKDKINYRAQGPRNVLTRQTVQGRANDGGLRIGEMERDGIIAHGATKFLNESMMVRGDQYYAAVCNQTGSIAIYNKSQNLFLSPQADGPLKFENITEYNANIVNISKFGREFSIIKIPYAFKLLMQELKTMNIEMRIITEDNIDQLTSLSFSDNIVKLTNNNVNNLLKNTNKIIKETEKYKENIVLERERNERNFEGYTRRTQYNPSSESTPSLQYNTSSEGTASPQYNPVTPEGTASPQYNPVTPEGTASPQYNPVTPEGTSSPPYNPLNFQATSSQSPPQYNPATPEGTPPSIESQEGGMLTTTINNNNFEPIKLGIVLLNDKIKTESFNSNNMNNINMNITDKPVVNNKINNSNSSSIINNDSILTNYSSSEDDNLNKVNNNEKEEGELKKIII
jgi:DNA-directed RNA polymerase beta subunit